MIALEWDYTQLADAYVKRPDYAGAAIDKLVETTGLGGGTRAIDLGAGAGHLTRMLAERGWYVLALEPNPAMRAHGVRRTLEWSTVEWIDGVMQDTGQASGSFSICTYGSSFGVADHASTLAEAARILKDGGWLACLFNHRDLDDPLQKTIEERIKSRVPTFSYGARRRDQREILASSGLFHCVRKYEARMIHAGPAADWIEAWRSHATLQRQAGEAFESIVDEIKAIVVDRCGDQVEVPYVTRLWVARRR